MDQDIITVMGWQISTLKKTAICEDILLEILRSNQPGMHVTSSFFLYYFLSFQVYKWFEQLF